MNETRILDPRQAEAKLISTSCRDLRIVVMLNDRAGCGHYRAILPLKILQRHGALVYFVDPAPAGQERVIDEQVWEGANVILLQRTSDPRILRLIGDRKRREELGRTLIYESDDDILHIDPKNPAARAHSDTLKRNTERIVRECDGLFVSTPELAAQWCRLNPRTFVLPNSIDFSIRQAWTMPVERQVGKEGDVVIGWAGGLHHVGDEQPLVGVLPDILRRFPQAHLAICSNPIIVTMFLARWGMGDLIHMAPVINPHSLIKQKGVVDMTPYPEFQRRWSRIDPMPFDTYPFVLQQFSIGLAPLESHQFNRSKSALRLLEYGAVGVPYVASPLASYVQFHRETAGCGGFIARDKRDWSEAITHLLEHPELREEMGRNLQQVIRERYNTDTVGLQWADAIRKVQAGGISTWTPRESPGKNGPCPCGAVDSRGKPIKYKRHCYPAFG